MVNEGKEYWILLVIGKWLVFFCIFRQFTFNSFIWKKRFFSLPYINIPIQFQYQLWSSPVIFMPMLHFLKEKKKENNQNNELPEIPSIKRSNPYSCSLHIIKMDLLDPWYLNVPQGTSSIRKIWEFIRKTQHYCLS